MRQAPEGYRAFTIRPLSSVVDGLGSNLLVVFWTMCLFVCARFLCNKVHDIGSLSLSFWLVNGKVNCTFYWNSIIFSDIGYYFAFKSIRFLLVMLHLYQNMYQKNFCEGRWKCPTVYICDYNNIYEYIVICNVCEDWSTHDPLACASLQVVAYRNRKIEIQVPCIPYLLTEVISCVLIIRVLSEFCFRQWIVYLLANFHVSFLLLSWILSRY
jgi:hypothetical protein